jgi:hypothetical protein
MAVTISSFVYIDKHRYMVHSKRMNGSTNKRRQNGGAPTMDLVSRLDLVDAIVRDRQRDSAAATQRRAALAGRPSAGRRRSLSDRLTIVLGGSTSPNRIAPSAS